MDSSRSLAQELDSPMIVSFAYSLSDSIQRNVHRCLHDTMSLTKLDFEKFTLYIAATNQFGLKCDLSLEPSDPATDLVSTTYWIELEDILA